MTTERESLPELQAHKQGTEEAIVASRNFMARLGVTDIVPNFQLDPQNIYQFRERRPLVVAINKRFLDIHIPAMQAEAEEVQVKIDSLLVETVQRVDEDLSVATSELEEAQKDVDAGLLPVTLLDGLKGVIEDLRSKQTQPDYLRAKEILEARKQDEKPIIPTKPIVTPEMEVKQRQIEAIRQNLGDPGRFTFPAGMTLEEIFEGYLEDRELIRVYNMLARSQLRSAEHILSMSVDEFFSLRNFGSKALDVTLEQLLKKGFLPKEQIDKPTSTRKFSRSRGTFEVELPDGITRNIAGEAKAEVLRRLVSAPNNTLKSGELATAVYGEDNVRNRARINNAIFALRKDLEGNYQIDQPVSLSEKAKGEQGIYILKKVDQKPQLTARQRREEYLKHVLPESRLSALNAFLGDPTINRDRIRDELGPSKNGNSLTYWNCVRALMNAVIFVKSRINRDIAVDEEKDVWNKFKAFIDGDPRDEVKRFYLILRGWYDDQKAQAAGQQFVGEAKIESEVTELEQAVEAADEGQEFEVRGWEYLMDLPKMEKILHRNTELRRIQRLVSKGYRKFSKSERRRLPFLS